MTPPRPVIPTTVIFNPQGNQTRFPEDLSGSQRKMIKKHPEKSSNTKMGHLYMRIQGLQLIKEKPPDTDFEENIKTNVVYCTTVDPSTTKEGKIYSYLCGRFPTTSGREKNTYMQCMCMTVIPS